MAESVEELRLKLAEYRSQLAEVEEILQEDDSDEMKQMKKDIVDLIKIAQQALNEAVSKQAKSALASAPVMKVVKYPVGSLVKARFSEDDKWYLANVVSVNVDTQQYSVKYAEYGNTEVRGLDDLQEAGEEEKKGNETRKRAREEEEKVQSFEEEEIPEHLLPRPEDTEEERLAKKKRIQSIKFRNKQKKKEKETHTKKAKWQDFVSSKKKKKKSGMMTSLKRESIFKSPDTVDGKVGVVGSGRGVTENSQRKVEHKKARITLPEEM